MKTKMRTIDQIFPVEIIEQAIKLNSVEEIHELIKPKIDIINKMTGQENNTRYLAYLLHWAIKNSVRG